MQTSEGMEEVIKALVKARGEFKPVVRDSTGQVGQNRQYKYADLAGVIDATTAALLGNGLVLVQAVDAANKCLISRLCHTSGQWIGCSYPLRDYDRPQEYGSQLTYARRYSMLGLLGVAQEDDDGAAAQHSKPTAQAGPPTELMEEGNWFGLVKRVDATAGKTKPKADGTGGGKPYTKYDIVGDDGTKFTTFSDTFKIVAEASDGEMKIHYRKRVRGGYDIVSIEPAGVGEALDG